MSTLCMSTSTCPDSGHLPMCGRLAHVVAVDPIQEERAAIAADTQELLEG